jgi:hypothetical protein
VSVQVGPGVDVAAVQQGQMLNVGVNWPTASGRLVADETRQIGISITGTGIAVPPTATLTFPETQVQIAAPAGPDRYMRFNEFDINGNLVKQSYVRLGIISAAGSADTTTVLGQYGPFYLDDQYFAQNKAGNAAAAPLVTDGSLTQVEVLDLVHSIDLSAPGGLYDDDDWYYFDIPTGPRQYATLVLRDLQQIVNANYSGHAATGLEMVVTPDGLKPVTDEGGGYPTTAANVIVNGVQSTGLNPLPMGVDLATGSVPIGVGQQVVEGFLPAGRYFVRVGFVDSAIAPLTYSQFGGHVGHFYSGSANPATAGQVAYQLTVQINAIAPVGP